ncbi:helix-turn-helix domain-containing protein [Streptomyces sp. NPDC006283]|uniref:helix-turn-helix domain-containing protein n=1 Tax=Streptomyces sp. NPDC006283 TaxID=3156741 RepID=UPI0033AE8254
MGVAAIAAELGCSQKTVRCWLHRFNRTGLESLEDLGGQGRKRRITEAERSRMGLSNERCNSGSWVTGGLLRAGRRR